MEKHSSAPRARWWVASYNYRAPALGARHGHAGVAVHGLRPGERANGVGESCLARFATARPPGARHTCGMTAGRPAGIDAGAVLLDRGGNVIGRGRTAGVDEYGNVLI